jgi:hypothetical protein
MGTVIFEKPRCINCTIEIDEEPGLPVEKRQACPKCGSLKRLQVASIDEILKIYGTLNAKGKRPGNNKPFIEIVSGTSFSYRLQKWMRKFRLIDRVSDVYKEIVIDPDTDLLIHKSEERLSEHVGHGSAKVKTNNS